MNTTEEEQKKIQAEYAKYDKYAEVDRRVLGEAFHVYPPVWLRGEGAVGRAAGNEPVAWLIHAENEGNGRGIHMQIAVDGHAVASVSVHARSETKSMWDEAQEVGAAIVWSAIRGVLRDRARLEFDPDYVAPKIRSGTFTTPGREGEEK